MTDQGNSSGAGYLYVRDRPLDPPPGAGLISPDDCAHEAFAVRAEVNRIVDVVGEAGRAIGYDLELAVDCLGCLTPFEFVGLPMGLSPRHPTGSVDQLVMTAPCRPHGSPPAFGFDRPGFSIEVFVADPDPDHPRSSGSGSAILNGTPCDRDTWHPAP